MSDLDDRILGKVSSDTDPFKKILSKVPGFSGYIERQSRRDADKMLRDTIASHFEELYQRLSRIQRDFVSQGEIAYIDDLEAAAIKLRAFIDRVRLATRGYSGLFDAAKINEEELARIYQYDAALLTLEDEVSRAIDNVEASVGTDGLPAAIRHLQTTAQQCVDTFNRRQEVIQGTGTASG